MFNPKQLRRARERLRLTRKQLASNASISASAIEKYEMGPSTPSPTHIKTLAKHLCVRPEFFFQGIIPSQLFQHQRLDRRSYRTQASTEIQLQLYHHFIQVLIEQSASTPFYKAAYIDDDIPPETSARDLKKQLGLSPAEGLENITVIAEEFGIPVVIVPLFGLKTGSVILCDQQYSRHAIFLSLYDTGEHQRLNLARALGHIFLNNGRNPHPDLEDRAIAYARELLMPASIMRNDIDAPSLDHLIKLKSRLKVPLHALIERGGPDDLAIWSEKRALQLKRQLSARGGKRYEPWPIGNVKPNLLRALFLIAQRQGFNLKQMSKKIHVSESVLNPLVLSFL